MSKNPTIIEELKNCPNCGGILNETGRCEFCGSKIYDFCDIDLSREKKGVNYIRIKVSDRIILAPVRVNKAVITSSIDSFPTLDINFIILGDLTMIDKTEKGKTNNEASL